MRAGAFLVFSLSLPLATNAQILEKSASAAFAKGRAPQGRDFADRWACFAQEHARTNQLRYRATEPIVVLGGRFQIDEPSGDSLRTLAATKNALVYRERLGKGFHSFLSYRAVDTNAGTRLILEESKFEGRKPASATISKVSNAPVMGHMACLPNEEVLGVREERLDERARQIFASGTQPRPSDLADRDGWTCVRAGNEQWVDANPGFEFAFRGSQGFVKTFAGHGALQLYTQKGALIAEDRPSANEVYKAAIKVAVVEEGVRAAIEYSSARPKKANAVPTSVEKSVVTNLGVDHYAYCLKTRELRARLFGDVAKAPSIRGPASVQDNAEESDDED